jgi:hypothetical protein
MSDNQIWNQLVLDVIYAASISMGSKDFELQCRLAPMENGKSYYDRIRVADELLRTGIIKLEDDFLKLGTKTAPPILISELKNGSELAWKISDNIYQNSNFSQKIDLELIHQIGLDGENAVIVELNKVLPFTEHHRIRHISLYDDSAGFDIHSPSIKNIESSVLLEVKTSPRPGNNFTFYISQNEARVASLNKNWTLLGVISQNLEYKILGFLTYHQFASFLPVNVDACARWETAKITVPRDIFTPGLP